MTTTKDFDLTDWLTGGTAHRLTKTATIYRDPNLANHVADYLNTQKQDGEEATGYDALGETTHDKEELLARLEASKATVTVFALIESELQEARDALGEKPAGYKYFEDMRFWYEVFARAARLEGHQLTATEWGKIHETIGMQFAQITRAYTAAATPDVSPRFRGLGTS